MEARYAGKYRDWPVGTAPKVTFNPKNVAWCTTHQHYTNMACFEDAEGCVAQLSHLKDLVEEHD